MEEIKRVLGEKAAMMIKDGQVVGLGSGSTVEKFIESLGRRIKSEDLEIIGIPSSYQSLILALENGIKVGSLNEYTPEITVDGADEIDQRKFMVKGGGSALLREKILMSCSKDVLVIVDETKLVEKISVGFVPIEVVKFGFKRTMDKISELGAKKVNLRVSPGKVGPIISDNGNIILDAFFGEINDPPSLEKELNSLPGVVENGIFTVRPKVLIGKRDGEEIKVAPG